LKKIVFWPRPERGKKMPKKKMNGFVKFVLLVLTTFFVIAMAMSVVLITSPRKAHAEQQMDLRNGTLTVWADVLKVQGIPKEITDPVVAYQLYSGQLKKVVVNGKIISYQPQSGVQYTNPWSVTPVR
jgi:hypothetical protein